MTEEIKLQGTITLEDKPARVWLQQLETKIVTINERTKGLVLEIRGLKKQITALHRGTKK